MPRKDLLFTAVAAVLIAFFLAPTLKNLGIWDVIQYRDIVLYVGLPIMAVCGMIVANYIGRFVPVLWQFAKFAMVGVLNTAIDFGILNFLIIYTGANTPEKLIPINAVSFTAAVTNSYFWNRSWVFKSKKKASFVIFFIVTLVGLGINTSIVYLLTKFLLPTLIADELVRANIAKAFATGFSLFWNFLGYKLVVFKK